MAVRSDRQVCTDESLEHGPDVNIISDHRDAIHVGSVPLSLFLKRERGAEGGVRVRHAALAMRNLVSESVHVMVTAMSGEHVGGWSTRPPWFTS